MKVEEKSQKGKGERGAVFHTKETANAKTLAWGCPREHEGDKCDRSTVSKEEGGRTPGGPGVENPPAKAGDAGSIPDSQKDRICQKTTKPHLLQLLSLFFRACEPLLLPAEAWAPRGPCCTR